MIILTFTRCSNHSALGFKFKTGLTSQFTTYHLLEVCLFTNVHEINQQYKQKPITCLTGLFKLFVACSSWRILKHRLNHFFHCHLLRIFESFHDTSKIPTFTLLIKTNGQLRIKILSCNFYFSENLTDFRHIILQPAGKFNPKFF